MTQDFSSKARPMSSQSASSSYLNNVYKLQDTSDFDVYHNPEKQMTYFIEKNPPKAGDHHLVYAFSNKSGNLTYGHGGKWARGELNSSSVAFHKGNKAKMPLPDNREVVLSRVQSHYDSYKPSTYVKTHC